MNGPSETTSTQPILLTPRTSLKNIGEKHDKDEENRTGNTFQAFGADGFTFLDFLDIINPLQHIPVVGSIYREITGDEIDPGARIAGGALFGGPIGLAFAATNTAVEQGSGKDIGGNLMALFNDNPAQDGPVMLANQPPPSDFVTGAGTAVSVEKLPDITSPITDNAEVLEWARRESARLSGHDDMANSNQPPAGSTDIAANIEVLNWARQEAALSQPVVEVAEVQTRDRRQAEKQQETEIQQATLNTTIALGRDQSQLSGAAAPLGGWFSETMLTALAKYDEGAQLGKSDSQRRVEETLNSSE